MKPSAGSIRRSIKLLRKLIDSSGDPVVFRIAYAVETALRWATTETTGWERPEKDVLIIAEFLRQDWEAQPRLRRMQ